MTRRYAQGTEVSVTKSVGEIRKVVLQFGAEQFATFESGSAMAVAFSCQNLSIRMEVDLPDRGADEFRYTSSRKLARPQEDVFRLWEKECRRRLRALAAVIKAKFIAIEDEVSNFEIEFMPYVVLASNQTVGECLQPQLQAAMDQKRLPERVMLPEPAASGDVIDCEGFRR